MSYVSPCAYGKWFDIGGEKFTWNKLNRPLIVSEQMTGFMYLCQKKNSHIKDWSSYLKNHSQSTLALVENYIIIRTFERKISLKTFQKWWENIRIYFLVCISVCVCAIILCDIFWINNVRNVDKWKTIFFFLIRWFSSII